MIRLAKEEDEEDLNPHHQKEQSGGEGEGVERDETLLKMTKRHNSLYRTARTQDY
jgi:hypothetical protein